MKTTLFALGFMSLLDGHINEKYNASRLRQRVLLAGHPPGGFGRVSFISVTFCQAGPDAGVVVEGMLPENLFVVLRLALAPILREQRQQLDLPPENSSAAVLLLNPMREFVRARQTKSYTLEDIEEELVRLTRREAFEFLSALDYDIVITARINFNVRTRPVL